METGVLTLWSLVHLASGILLAFLFSYKFTRFIEFAGIAFVPLLFVNFTPIRIISLVIIFISFFAFLETYSSNKTKKPNFEIDIPLALFLLILWEVFEFITSPFTNFGNESILNHTSDVIVGFIGFLSLFLFINRNKKGKRKSKKRSKKRK